LARGRLLWAGGIALGVVLLGLALLFLRGEQDRISEASVGEVSQEGSTSQAEMKPSTEPNVAGATASPSSEPALLQGGDKTPDPSAQRTASSGLAETRPSDKARRENTKATSSARPVVPSRKAIPELFREEKAPRETEQIVDERRESPLVDGQGRRSQSPAPATGSSIEETSGTEAEEVEPGRVIDWLLEKREKK
jgi:hypothetical protein